MIIVDYSLLLSGIDLYFDDRRLQFTVARYPVSDRCAGRRGGGFVDKVLYSISQVRDLPPCNRRLQFTVIWKFIYILMTVDFSLRSHGTRSPTGELVDELEVFVCKVFYSISQVRDLPPCNRRLQSTVIWKFIYILMTVDFRLRSYGNRSPTGVLVDELEVSLIKCFIPFRRSQTCRRATVDCSLRLSGNRELSTGSPYFLSFNWFFPQRLSQNLLQQLFILCFTFFDACF